MTFLEAIKSLGQTPEEVTLALREKGIKGYRQMASSCPIARYLNACGFPRVTVASSAKRYQNEFVEKEHDAEESVSLPKGVQDWITRFDDGQYPEFYLV